MRFKHISCRLGIHRYRATDIKVTMIDEDRCDVSRTCCGCGFTEHFLTRLTVMDKVAKDLHEELEKDEIT